MTRFMMRAVLALVASSGGTLALAQAAAPSHLPPEQMQRGGTYHPPPARVDPVYLPQGPAQRADAGWGADAAPARLDLRLALRTPLRSQAASGVATQGGLPRSPTLQLHVRYTPWSDAGWFAQAAFYRYLRQSGQQSWDPDFSYSFGYDVPGVQGLSLGYANYTGNRLRPQAGERRSDFAQGQWSLGYRFPLPEPVTPLLLVGDGDEASCRTDLHYTARYVDNDNGQLRRGKHSVSLGCRYTRPGGWHAHLTLFSYPERSLQQPWDPDFTYGVGLLDTLTGTLSLQYENYSGSRYPGRRRSSGEGGVRDGGLTLSWRSSW